MIEVNDLDGDCLYVIVLNQMAISIRDEYCNSQMVELPYDKAIQYVDELKAKDNQDYKIMPQTEYFEKRMALARKLENFEFNLSKREIKYEDYVNMCSDEKDKENICNAFFRATSVTFVEYLEYMIKTNFIEVKKRLFEGIDIKKFQKRTNDDLIEGILVLTDKEKQKRLLDNNYYMCNAICAYEMLKKIFTVKLLNVLKSENVPRIISHNYCHILRYFLLDIDQLINQYQNSIKENYEYKASVSRNIHTMSLHNILRQSLFGQVSIHSFADVEIDASIAVIRQMIELRIRRAFGVIAVVDKGGNIKPLEMTRVFETLNKYKESIQFPMKLSSIERIYKWANLYIHSGKGDYAWTPYFIECFLRDFSFGELKADKSWSFKNAIKTTEKTLNLIQQEVIQSKVELNEQPREKIKEDTNISLLSCSPEIEII